MTVAVDVFVKDTQLVPQPIESVVINVYDSITLALITSVTSDSSGDAAFSLPGSASPGTNYELRLFKSGVIFQNPVSIAVLEPVMSPDTNQFDISGTVVTDPVATDPRMCRCTGQFIGFDGRPVPNTLIRVQAIEGAGSLTKQPDTPIPPFLLSPPPAPPNIITGFQVPKILDGKMVSVGTMEFRTDINGRVSFDLIRNGMYYFSFAGEEDHIWPMCVPDRSSANLIGLVHPEPVLLTWNQTDAPSNATTVAVGQTVNVHFTVLFSNFISYAVNLANIILFTNSDGTLADVVHDSGVGQVTITGRTAGTIGVTVGIMPNMTPSRIPTYSITAATLAVTITP